ncbi:MAG: ABC transporter ATP-binding protein [Bacteroidetes bacterium]|nr:ABC transporter ATP-binding protein [Bacteroidota bacterium]
MIEVKNLSKQYAGTVVLDIPEMEIKKGESFGLVGNNGAGKTTFFRLILDLIRANTGSVTSNGLEVSASVEWKNYTGSYLDEGFLIDFLTPEEYFEFLADINGLSSGDLQDFYLRFGDFFNQEVLGKNKYIRDLSAGNQQKVGIAASMIADPKVLILDEPFNSLDPSTQIRLVRMLNEFQQEKQITMLISSHDLNHISEVCQRIVILERGKVVHDLQKSPTTLIELEKYFAV